MSGSKPRPPETTASSHFLLGAYLAQLLVPLFFLIDALRALRADEAGVCEKAAIAIGAMWVLLCLGALAYARDRRRFLHRMSGPLTLVYALYLSVALAEFGTRIVIQHSNRAPLFFQPGAKMVLDLTSWRMPGTSPKVTFTVNQLGLRGPMPPAGNHVYKIITVGGSTTECVALDDSEEWPHLLMQWLNERQKQTFVWVGNAGVSALTTVDHLNALRRIPILSQADLLIFLIGINDLESALEFGGAPTQTALEYKAELFAEHAVPGVTLTGGIFRRAWLFALTRLAIRDLASSSKTSRPARVNGPQNFELAKRRAAGPVLSLPNLTVNLQEYALRIRKLESECRLRNLRCVYLTQPTMWRADLSPEERDLLWLGMIGRKGAIIGYALAGDLERAMDAFNQTLLRVCQEDHLECYDLAAPIPKDTSAFYDDAHFNIGGARMVASFLTNHLLPTLPKR